MNKPEERTFPLSSLLRSLRVRGILANVALSHRPGCNCDTVCRPLKEINERLKAPRP